MLGQVEILPQPPAGVLKGNDDVRDPGASDRRTKRRVCSAQFRACRVQRRAWHLVDWCAIAATPLARGRAIIVWWMPRGNAAKRVVLGCWEVWMRSAVSDWDRTLVRLWQHATVGRDSNTMIAVSNNCLSIDTLF